MSTIVIQLDSPVGPRVLSDGDVDEQELEASLPDPWVVSWETPAVKLSDGRWSYPPVKGLPVEAW